MKAVRLLIEKSITEKIYTAFFKQALPTDLLIALLWLIIDILAIFLPVLSDTPVRFILILPGILFLPGYCLIAALLPKDSDIDLSERIALSFGLSITVVPLIVFGLNFTSWGIWLAPILVSLTIFTLVMILVAHYRRSLLPFNERLFHQFDRGSFVKILNTIRNAIFPKEEGRVDRLLTIVLIVAIIIAVLATIYLITVPKEGERFTEFFILGEKQKVADYPDVIRNGQNYPLSIGVGNHEFQNTNYTIETWLVRTEIDTITNTSRLIAMVPHEKFSFILASNETRIIPYNLSVNKTTYNRVEFLLFKDKGYDTNLTGSDRINASYRELHLLITVR